MEWYHWTSIVTIAAGVVATFAVSKYRIGQLEKSRKEDAENLEKKMKEMKEDSISRCSRCLEQRKEERNEESHKYERAVSLAEHNSAMLAAHIANNASEHTAMQISAARTEEQLKALNHKMDELSRSIAHISRVMHSRDYRPQTTDTDTLERKG